MNPFIVTVPVCIELLLTTMETRLCFGTFNSRQDAENWMARFELERANLENAENADFDATLEFTGLPSRAFVSAHTYVCDVFGTSLSARRGYSVIPPDQPEDAARKVQVYALRALQEATTFGLACVEETEEG